jgi:serine/threonine protein kinase
VQYACEQPELPTLGDYDLCNWVGRGSSASVFLAFSTQDKARRQPYVVKLLTHQDHARRQAFLAECAIMAQLGQAPNIVPYVTHTTDSQELYLVLHYIRGATLQSLLRLREEAKVPPSVVMEVGIHIGQALQALHDQGKVHCDIKPENILISHMGEIFLADLGAVTNTNTAPTFATRLYAPREFYAEQRGVATPATDIYSLGAVMYELLYGKYFDPTALAGESMQEQEDVSTRRVSEAMATTTASVAQSGQSEPPVTTTTLEGIISRCLGREAPGYSQVSELIADLQQAQQQLERSAAQTDIRTIIHELEMFSA